MWQNSYGDSPLGLFSIDGDSVSGCWHPVEVSDIADVIRGISMQWRTHEFCSVGGGGSTNSVGHRGQRERGSEGGSLLVRGSGGSCNLLQEISFHIVKFS